MKPILRLIVIGASHALICASFAATVMVPQQGDLEDNPLFSRLDTSVKNGFDHPDEALHDLEKLAARASGTADRQRILLAQGLVLAEDGREAAATAVATKIRSEADRLHDPMVGAGANLVLAALARQQDRADLGGRQAEIALDTYRRLCLPSTHPSVCDYRDEWFSLQILAEGAYASGNTVASGARWQQAYDLALRMADGYRQAISLSQLAASASDNGDLALARRLAARAGRAARQLGEPAALARVKLAETNIADSSTAGNDTLGTSLEGRHLARLAGSPRLEARFDVNVSDYYVKHGRPLDALAAIGRALPAARLHHDRRVERLLLHNAALAHIGLRQIGEAQAATDAMLSGWENGDGQGMQVTALRELSDAFAAVGDFSQALALYHRERKLAADIVARNRAAVLEELQGRSDSDRQQRSIEFLERDNALQAIELSNQRLIQRVGASVVTAVLLVLGFSVPLVRRAQRTKSRLTDAQAELRKRSERDPLTGLANRRRFNDEMELRSLTCEFEGALLLVDLDYFKRINDGCGHAAGDAVLIEVAKRLRDAVREEDFVTRWGGEEFLVFVPDMGPEQLKALAGRLLRVVSDGPVSVDGKLLHLTASIGYCGFPLPPNLIATKVEQAVNIVDLALYRAKRQGRNAAVCVLSASGAVNSQTLGDLALEFDAASTDGRVELLTTLGSQVSSSNPAASSAR